MIEVVTAPRIIENTRFVELEDLLISLTVVTPKKCEKWQKHITTLVDEMGQSHPICWTVKLFSIQTYKGANERQDHSFYVHSDRDRLLRDSFH